MGQIGGSASIALLHQDSYYLPNPPSQLKVHGEFNFDHPGAFDSASLCDHLQRLKEGLAVQVPVYDFNLSRRTPETGTRWDLVVRVSWSRGFSCSGCENSRFFDLKIYLHVDADIRFIRRLHRDVRERGRSLDGIIRQYYDTVRPMHREFRNRPDSTPISSAAKRPIWPRTLSPLG